MTPVDLQYAREQYLQKLFTRYGTVALPIASANYTLPLQTVFQPMVLHRDPFAPRNQQGREAMDIIRAKNGVEALSKSEAGRMIVLGGPGMGKTTALKALLSTAIGTAQDNRSAPLPLFISLPDLARTGLSLEGYIRQLIADLDIDAYFADMAIQVLRNGEAFLCLDSLDEILPGLRPNIIALLNEEALRCQGTWIIGSRFTEYKGGQFAHSQFTEWELQTLDVQERLALAHQLLVALYNVFYGDTAPNLKPAIPSAQAFIEALQENAHIATWGENPLLLSLAAVLYVQMGRLPGNRAVLYAQVTEAMFALRLHDAEQRAEMRDLLAEIALEFYQTRGRNFSVADVEEFLSALIPHQDAQALYATLTNILASGVVEPVMDRVYGFKHQMFQEYLAAVALARHYMNSGQRQRAWDLLWRKRQFSRWNEILRLFAGILVQEYGAEGSRLVCTWLSGLAREHSTPEGDPGNLCLILAMKTLDELGEHVSEPEIADLAQQIIERWAQTFMELYRAGGWKYAQSLREQARVLWAFNIQIVAPIITRFQQYDPHFHLLWSIPVAPGVVDTTIPINILWYLFEDSLLSYYACYSPSALQTPVIVERLIALVENSDGQWSGEERAEGLTLLGKMGELTPVSFLIKLWQDTELPENLRHKAAQALSETQAFVPLDTFLAMLNDPYHSRRCVAVDVLSKRSGRTHADLLVAALHDANCYVREHALCCVHELGMPVPIDLLQELFYDEHEAVSKEALSCLQELGEFVPLELWLDALQSEYEWVRDAALVFIERQKDLIPVDSLLAMLSLRKKDCYRRNDVRTHCIRALGLLGDRVPLEPLLALLQDNDEQIRSQALLVLAQRHVILPTDMLLLLLERPVTGEAAAQAIALLGADAPISALLEKARNNTHSAIRALRLLYRYVPTEPVWALFQDEEISESYQGTYWELVQLLRLQGVEIPLEVYARALKRVWSRDEVASIIEPLRQAGAQAPIELLLRVANEDARNSLSHPEWIQQLFYVLYAWVTPENLINALSNLPGDQWLAVSLLGQVHDDESIQLLKEVAQDPTRDRTTRSEAMAVLSDLGINLPLEYLIQATRWCIYEGMAGYLVDTVKRLGQQTPLEQLLPLLGEDHNRLQPGVVDALVEIAEHIPLEIILPLLDDKDEEVRKAAILILGAMRERAPFEALVAIFQDPQQALETRCTVLSAFGEMGTPASVDYILAALDDEDEEIRRHAVWALKDDEMQRTRGGIRVLKEQGKEIPLESLLKLINDPDDNIARNAIQVLGELASLGVAVPAEPLVALMSDEDEFIVGEAAEALCLFGERAPVGVLVSHLSSTTDEEIRSDLFYALSKLKAHAPLDIMLAFLSEDDKPMDGWQMKWALENLAEAMPEQVLQKFHADPQPEMRKAVLHAIEVARATEWLPLVLATLQDVDGHYTAHDHQVYGNDGAVRTAALQALGALHACAPVEPLLHLLNTNTEELSYNDKRIVVLEALRQFGSRVPLADLLRVLGSGHREICLPAFQHIQEFYPDALDELVPALKAILRGEPVQGAFAAWKYRRIAGTVALMGRATPPVMQMVVDLLDHPFWEIRVSAAKTLSALRRNIPDRAIRRLLDLRKDPESPDVCAAADQALAEILSLEHALEDE